MFFINAASTLIPLHFLFVLSTICDFWLLKLSINFTLIVIYSKTAHHFVHTILSNDILSVYHSVRIPFCPYRPVTVDSKRWGFGEFVGWVRYWYSSTIAEAVPCQGRTMHVSLCVSANSAYWWDETPSGSITTLVLVRAREPSDWSLASWIFLVHFLLMMHRHIS